MIEEKGMSKREFGRKLKVDSATVFRYFRAGYNPTLETLDKFATVLNCRIADLIEEKTRPKRENS
jgi:transcriptional regulator with XRE-family HTH domain